MTGEKVDPRFDPMFQRGYVTSAATSADAPRQRAAAAPPARQAETPANAVQSPPVVVTEVFGEEVKPRASWFNPFIVLLWLAGPALVAGGVNGYLRTFQAQFAPPGGMDEAAMALQQLAWVVSPGMVTVGMGIVAGLLFWHAAQWRNRRR